MILGLELREGDGLFAQVNPKVSIESPTFDGWVKLVMQEHDAVCAILCEEAGRRFFVLKEWHRT